MMIAFLGASAMTLIALQATINAPTQTFKSCLREASVKAKAEKVAPDGIDQYLRSACTVEMDGLKSALTTFQTKNGMTRKAAADDAQLTVEDYLSAPVDKYKFMATVNAKPAAKAAGTPAPVAAAAPAEPKQ